MTDPKMDDIVERLALRVLRDSRKRDEANMKAAFAKIVEPEILALRAERDALRKIVAAAADAIDVADGIIETNLGTDVPKEWDRAFKRVAKARAALQEKRNG